MITFKEMEIIGLFGETDIKIPIKNNRVILVDYNGIGKSTILNIFYYFISQQWHKLMDQEFVSITIRVKNNNRKLKLDKADLVEYIETQRRSRRGSKYGMRHSPRLLKDAILILRQKSRKSSHGGLWGNSASLRHYIEILKEELGVPLRVAEDLALEARHLSQLEIEFDSSAQENIRNVDNFLSENLGGRILYLPTYRRIEKDIKTVFPEIEDEIRTKLSRRRRDSLANESYIELVQFGMEDVKENLESRLENVKAFALSQINALTTKYLRDVIRDEARVRTH